MLRINEETENFTQEEESENNYESQICLMNKELTTDYVEKLILTMKHNFLSKILEINLSNNKLAVIPIGLEYISNLISLDFSFNNIQAIKNLNQCKKLEYLNLANNEIKIVGEGLFGLKSLMTLNIKNNKILINNTMIRSLAMNQNLIQLSLEGNLDYDFSILKIRCLENLKKLEILDGKQIFKKKTTKSDTSNFHSNVYIETVSGSSTKIKTLKDYIKFKKKDVDENGTIYTDLTQRFNTQQNELDKKRETNRSNKMPVKTYYYFQQIKPFNKKLI
jgi:Leucine-rich repeat (LRR) protein